MLARLAQKFSVPAAFIITSDALILPQQKRITELLSSLKVESETEIQVASEEIQMLIQNTGISDELKEQLHEAYYALNIDEGHSLHELIETGEDPLVVLRASPLFPVEMGVYAPLMSIQGLDALLQEVLTMWTALYSPEGITAMLQAKQIEPRIALIVQKMIDSQQSGIIHTSYKMNPEEVLILGCKGLGTACTSGLISPDKYFITKKSLNIALIETGKQPFMFERDFDTNKVAKVYLQEEYSKKQKIPDKHIGELTLMANRIEQMFGKPQEVEFAIYKEHISLLGTTEAQWCKDQNKKSTVQDAVQVPEQSKEEIEQKEKEISSGITQELEQDTLVVHALSGTAQHILGEAPEAAQSNLVESRVQQNIPADPNDINAVILGIDFNTMLSEVTQIATVTIQEIAIASTAVDPAQSLQTSSIILEKQTPVVITEAVVEEKQAVEEMQKQKEGITEPVQTMEQRELSTFEKTAGNLIIQCFKELKAMLPKEQWAVSPELRHLAVLAQNFSQKNVPPTAAQVKFAMDALEKVKK